MRSGQHRQPGAGRQRRDAREVRRRRRRRKASSISAARCCPAFDGRRMAGPGAAARRALARRARRRRAAAGHRASRCATRSRWSRTTGRGCWCWTPPPTRAIAPGFATAMTSELQWVLTAPITDLLRYRAESHTSFRHGPTSIAAVLPEYLELPAGFNPRTIELADQWRSNPALARGGAPAWCRRRCTRLRTGGYQLHAGPRRLRRAHGGRVLVRQARRLLRAHRVRLRGPDARHGHPCAAGHRLPGRRAQPGRRLLGRAPERCACLGRGVAGRPRLGARRSHRRRGAGPHRLAAAAAAGARPDGQRAGQRSPPNCAATLRAFWDAVNNGWNQWVLNYTQSKQLDLLKNLGFELAELGRPEPAGAGPDRRRGPVRRGLDRVGPAPARSLAAPARTRAATAAAPRARSCGRVRRRAKSPRC